MTTIHHTFRMGKMHHYSITVQSPPNMTDQWINTNIFLDEFDIMTSIGSKYFYFSIAIIIIIIT